MAKGPLTTAAPAGQYRTAAITISELFRVRDLLPPRRCRIGLQSGPGFVFFDFHLSWPIVEL